MPLSTVCVSTVSSRPRAWSSFTNLRARDEHGVHAMNSTEEISKYREPISSFYAPTLTRSAHGYSYEFPEKPSKKDKKWSIGSLFRRKKKEEESSSEEEQKKGFLSRRKKKPEKRKKTKTIGTFDHIVLPQTHRNSSLYSNGIEENGILSDPTNFNNYIGRALPKIPTQQAYLEVPKFTKESVEDLNNSRSSMGSGSVDNSNRRSRKVLAKARAEARRTTLKKDSSSDEDSQRSNSSQRIRSEDNLSRACRDGSFNRRSRAARTERYLKRHSRDGENPNNYLRLSKSDAENSAFLRLSDDSNRSPSRSPISPNQVKLSYTSLVSQSTNISGLSTIPPPSHGCLGRFRVSNSTSNPTYKPPVSMNEYNSGRYLDVDLNNQRSVSCEANMHKNPSAELTPGVIHVQLPVTKPNSRYRNLSLVEGIPKKQPPPPPPRDPKRLLTQYFESITPNTYYFDNTGQLRSKSFNMSSHTLQARRNTNSFHLQPSYRSNSEDHLMRSNSVYLNERPASTTPEVTSKDSYRYLMDKNPRSRKPIFIKNGVQQPKNQTNGFVYNNAVTNGAKPDTRRVIDFWKQKDDEERFLEKMKARKSNSPQMFTSHTHVQNQIFLPSVIQKSNQLNNNTAESRVNDPKVVENGNPTTEELERKSSNLEDALDELEAIYNSLRLGDEDLLERAEKREKDAAAQKLLESKAEPYPGCLPSRGAMSDSNFNYGLDTVDSPKRRYLKKARTSDPKTDDMAFRKLHKERAATIHDPQSVIGTVSYLLASPVHVNDAEAESRKDNEDEPDIVLDDVVYRTIKHANNTLKVTEPQPPFGIPVGPVTPAANSDYLHAVPETSPRSTFKSRKIPDIVKDDLAYRNLRKDDNKAPALPPLSADDLKNNNTFERKIDLSSLKKKRAIRSLSANIGNLVNYEMLDSAKKDVPNEFKTLTDIADAMEIARQVLREKERKISATKRAFLSDTDATEIKYLRYPTTAESRLNFLNNMTKHSCSNENVSSVEVTSKSMLGDDLVSGKPPRGSPDRGSSNSPPKEKARASSSPLETRRRVSSFDEMLTAFALEAKETSDRITQELKDLGDEREKRLSLKSIEEAAQSLQDIADDEQNEKNTDIVKKFSEIDQVSDRARECKHLLDQVVDKVKQCENETEEEEPEILESVASITLKPVSCDTNLESEHDYENLASDCVDELPLLEAANENDRPKSIFEEKKTALIATFKDLQVEDFIPEVVKEIETKDEENGNDDKQTNSVYDNLSASDELNKNTDGVTGESCVDVVSLPAFLQPISECDPNHACHHNNTHNSDTILDSADNNYTDSETSSGFFSRGSALEFDTIASVTDYDLSATKSNNLDSLESLKSPKLVLETTKCNL